MSRAQQERREFWRQLVAQQEQNGVTVRAFCRQHRVSEYSFYQWRKRLAQQLPVKFALVDTNRSLPAAAGVEVILITGERLRIAAGADAATLRLALSVLRERR